MAQHARPVGPSVTNAAAPFGSEMVRGSRPDFAADRFTRARFVARQGCQVSQPTHVAAPFAPNMAQGATLPPRFRERLPLRTGWSVSQPTHVAATFAPNMVSDPRPPRYRQLLPPRSDYDFIPPDVASFSPEMVQGTAPPPMHRVWQSAGWIASLPTSDSAPFSVEMAQGAVPAQGRAWLPLRLGAIAVPPDVLSFSIEMVQGCRPDRVQFTLHPIGLAVSPQVHDEAPFGAEMSQGATVPRFREVLPLRVGWRQWVSDINPLSPEMTVGSRPDSPRVQLGPRIPLPWSQTTHVSAPFAPEMVQGAVSGRNRERLPLRTGMSLWVSDIDPFSIEMAVGSRPDRARVFLAPRIPLPSSQPTHVSATFTVDMVQGSRPERHRERLPLRTGWLTAQTTHVSADVSVEMMAGSTPGRWRAFLPLRTGVQQYPMTPVAAPFSIEMSHGWRPDRGHQIRQTRLVPRYYVVLDPRTVEAIATMGVYVRAEATMIEVRPDATVIQARPDVGTFEIE